MATGPVLSPKRARDALRTVEVREVRPFLSDLRTGPFLALFLCLFAVTLLPLLLFETPSIADYPNHLARVHVLDHPDVFRDVYVTRWGILPNLAFDGVVGALSRVMPLPAAGKVFLALTLLLLALGTVLLHRQLFGEWAAWPCLSLALLFNRVLLTGVVGYLFGLGLALLATAAWLGFRDRPPGRRLVLGVALTTVLFFAHFMALAVYGIIVFAAELARVRDAAPGDRRRALAGLLVTVLQGVPPLLALLLLTPMTNRSGRIVFRSLLGRVEALGTPFLVYSPVLDLALGATLLLVVLHAIRTKRLAMPSGILWALVALSAVHLLLPDVILTLEGADRRLPIAAALLFLGGTRLRVRRSRASKGVAFALVLLFAGRMAGVLDHWRSDGVAYADAREVMASIEPGSRVLPAYPPDAFGTVVQRSFAVYYLPVWETVRRGGFSPDLFAFTTQQPVRMTPPAWRLATMLRPPRVWELRAGSGAEPATAGEEASLACYDYVVFVNHEPFTVARTEGLDLVAARPCAKLFRVRRGEGAPRGPLPSTSALPGTTSSRSSRRR